MTGEAAEPAALRRVAAVVGPAMTRAVDDLHPSLRPSVDHHLAGVGKGVRATVAVLAAEACGGTAHDGVPGAVAVELVHNFSLIHDDVMDHDLERRHRPTVWAAFGTGTAIVAGDALSVLATQVLLRHGGRGIAAAEVLARATQEMIAGQALDLAFETRSRIDLEEGLSMVRGKTGALLSGAAEMGAVLAGASHAHARALGEFGMHVGIAFQAVDDVLGIWGDPARTGKPVGSDLLQHKKSLPVAAVVGVVDDAVASAITDRLAGPLDAESVVALSAELEELGGRTMMVQLAEDHLRAATSALAGVSLTRGPADELVEIARFVTERNR